MIRRLLRSLLGRPHRIVGAWYVDAVAPYRPHLVTFTETEPGRGVLVFSNPTNVQDGPDAGVKVTDSTGHGHWVAESDRRIVGTMWQENALQPARTRGPRLAVSFVIYVSRTMFEGPARAELIDGVSGYVIEDNPSSLIGSRLPLRWASITKARATN